MTGPSATARLEARAISPVLPATRTGYLVVAVVVLAIQTVLAGKTLPWSEIWSEAPLFHIDAAYHWYCMKLPVNLAATGNIVGYHPFFAAGHINGIHYHFSARMPALLA